MGHVVSEIPDRMQECRDPAPAGLCTSPAASASASAAAADRLIEQIPQIRSVIVSASSGPRQHDPFSRGTSANWQAAATPVASISSRISDPPRPG
ncbi:MAG: hypothetical protein R3D80_02765 [Paracoccaceae bacterium]